MNFSVPGGEPELQDNCVDDPKYDCSFLKDRGDCMLLGWKVSKICAKTCEYCKEGNS